MAKIKEMKGFVQICEDACIALGDAITKLQNLPDKCVDLIRNTYSNTSMKTPTTLSISSMAVR